MKEACLVTGMRSEALQHFVSIGELPEVVIAVPRGNRTEILGKGFFLEDVIELFNRFSIRRIQKDTVVLLRSSRDSRMATWGKLL